MGYAVFLWKFVPPYPGSVIVSGDKPRDAKAASKDDCWLLFPLYPVSITVEPLHSTINLSGTL